MSEASCFRAAVGLTGLLGLVLLPPARLVKVPLGLTGASPFGGVMSITDG